MTPSATIVRRHDVNDDLFVLWLQPRVPFTFKAGQYITIGTGGIERPYSIVSAPYEPHLELFIERVPREKGGALSPLLHALRVGDAVTIRPGAKGRFTLDTTAHHHVMVATVTGIAPFVSMIRQAMHERERAPGDHADQRFYVLHGASFADEFVYDRELYRLGEADPQFIQYVPSVSRPTDARNAHWQGTVGRVNRILEEQIARWSPPQADTVIYLCGQSGMVEDAERRLAPQGWAITKERYARRGPRTPRAAGDTTTSEVRGAGGHAPSAADRG